MNIVKIQHYQHLQTVFNKYYLCSQYDMRVYIFAEEIKNFYKNLQKFTIFQSNYQREHVLKKYIHKQVPNTFLH